MKEKRFSELSVAGRVLLVVLMTLFLMVANIAESASEPDQKKPIELTFSSHMPPVSIFSVAAEWWTKEIEKATNGRIKFTLFFAGTLIKGDSALTELLAGTADICYVSAMNMRELFPIGIMIHQCFFGAKLSDVHVIMKAIMDNFPEAAAEWGKAKTLAYMGPGPTHLHSIKPVYTLDDLKGKQIWITGQWGVQTLKKLGASPVSLPPSEMYGALEKAIIDAGMAPIDSLRTFKIHEVTSATTFLNLQSAPSSRVVMNLESFSKLPSDLQKIIDDSLPAFQEHFRDVMIRSDEECVTLGKDHGHKFIDLPPQDQEKFFSLLGIEAQEAAAKIDAKGLPGTKIFNFTRDLIEKRK